MTKLENYPSHTRSNKRREIKLIKKGLCGKCGRDQINQERSRKWCEACLDKQKKRLRKYKQKKKSRWKQNT